MIDAEALPSLQMIIYCIIRCATVHVPSLKTVTSHAKGAQENTPANPGLPSTSESLTEAVASAMSQVRFVSFMLTGLQAMHTGDTER